MAKDKGVTLQKSFAIELQAIVEYFRANGLIPATGRTTTPISNQRMIYVRNDEAEAAHDAHCRCQATIDYGPVRCHSCTEQLDDGGTVEHDDRIYCGACGGQYRRHRTVTLDAVASKIPPARRARIDEQVDAALEIFEDDHELMTWLSDGADFETLDLDDAMLIESFAHAIGFLEGVGLALDVEAAIVVAASKAWR